MSQVQPVMNPRSATTVEIPSPATLGKAASAAVETLLASPALNKLVACGLVAIGVVFHSELGNELALGVTSLGGVGAIAVHVVQWLTGTRAPAK